MTALKRFENKYTPASADACWLWHGCVASHGYGSFRNEQQRMDLAHRFAYRAYVGPVPDDLCVLHRCDVPLCVNPEHLWLGTKADNNLDKSRKGRAPRNGGARGEQNYNTKLTTSQVLDIRISASSETYLAQQYGVNRATIGKIRRGERWRHIHG